MSLFAELNAASGGIHHKETYLRAPFPYPGGKSRSMRYLLPHLPYRKGYIEPFGGSGCILLARDPSEFEVFNDRFAGVVAFYQCMRDNKLYERLIKWLDLTIHSREDFEIAKETWMQTEDTVIRAGLWYYMINYSFGGIGRNWGRSVKYRGIMSGKIRKKLKYFSRIHYRFHSVQVENQDWRDCLSDYDNKEHVFYLDPPYIDAYTGTYRYEMTTDEHGEMLDRIFEMNAFVAVSSYQNNLYDSYPWTASWRWKSNVSITPRVFCDSNHKTDLECGDRRVDAHEYLYIKE